MSVSHTLSDDTIWRWFLLNSRFIATPALHDTTHIIILVEVAVESFNLLIILNSILFASLSFACCYFWRCVHTHAHTPTHTHIHYPCLSLVLRRNKWLSLCWLSISVEQLSNGFLTTCVFLVVEVVQFCEITSFNSWLFFLLLGGFQHTLKNNNCQASVRSKFNFSFLPCLSTVFFNVL